jgi:LacI family transcriptional regulator
MTIHEIAQEAGVSIATVSRVLNNGPVSPDKKAKVEAVIAKHRFTPSLQARGLVNRQSDAIGLITHGIMNHFNLDFIEVVERRFSEMDLLLYVCICQREKQRENEERYLHNLVSRQVNGIILHDANPDNYHSGLIQHIASIVPLVMVHSLPEAEGVNSVGVDQELGMRRVMEHLLDLGHRDILFLRGAVGYSYETKCQVWSRCLEESGIPAPAENVVVVPEGNSEEGIGQAEELVFGFISQRGRPPTAIFGCNDIMAAGALNAVRKLGLSVPEDVSIVGHDNTILAASGSFTSVDLKTASVGHAAIDLLSYAMNGADKEPRRVIITPEVIHRGSTGPAQG